MEEPAEPKVVIKSALLTGAEADIRLRKAFDILCNEVRSGCGKQENSGGRGSEKSTDVIVDEVSGQV